MRDRADAAWRRTAADHGDPRGLGAVGRRARPARRTGLGVDRPGEWRHPVGPGAAGELVGAKGPGRPADRSGDVPDPGRAAAWLPHAAGEVRRRGGVLRADRHARLGRLPERMGDRRAWGVATQLYSVRSAQSWGVGDVADLADLAVWAGAEHGAGFVLVNPLHAAEPAARMEPSPYLPTTRRFQNPLYLRVERIREYADLDAPPAKRWTALRKVMRTRTWTARPDRPGRRLGGEAGGAASSCTRCRGPPAGRSPTAPTGTARVTAWTTSRPGARWPRNTGRTGTTGRRSCSIRRRRRSGRFRAANRGRGGLSTAGCSGCWTSNSPATQAAALRAGHVAGRDARPRGRRAPGGIRLVGAAGRFRPRHHGGCAAGRVQPERAGLGSAAVAARPAGRAGVRPVPRHGLDRAALGRRGAGRPHHRAVPAVVDPRRERPDGRAPTSATTTRRWSASWRWRRYGRGALVVGEDLGTVEPWARDYLRERGHSGHLDPVVRVRVRRQRGAAAAGVVARVLPGVGDHPRPAAHRRVPGRRSRAAAGRPWGC